MYNLTKQASKQMKLIFFSSFVTGFRYGVVSEPGTGVCVCDGMHSSSDCQLYSMFLSVPLCSSHTGEWLYIAFIE
jgi:hypothetical protein